MVAQVRLQVVPNDGGITNIRGVANGGSCHILKPVIQELSDLHLARLLDYTVDGRSLKLRELLEDFALGLGPDFSALASALRVVAKRDDRTPVLAPTLLSLEYGTFLTSSATSLH